MTTTLSVSIRRPTLRSSFRRLRAERRELRALRDELAQYSTPAQRLELWELLRRHSPEETAQVRALISRP
jgi:hypothetical protein